MMEAETAPIVISRSVIRRAVAAAAFGNAMEWFDFGLYNYLIATIGEVFFPPSLGQGSFGQTLMAMTAFTAAFLIRPVGGAFFGAMGDRIGRKRTLSLTMILMATGTMSIGCIPGYSSIGPAAPALLLAARLLQGFSTGGEYSGAITFIAEFAPDRRRGFYGSWLEVGTCAGFVLGAALAALITDTMSSAERLSWGWRIPFLLAGPAGLIGLYIRLRLDDTPAFQRLHAQGNTHPGGLRAYRATPWRDVLGCGALVILFNVPDFILLSYIPTYMTQALALAEGRALTISALLLLFMMPLIPAAGWLSDRIGRRRIIGAGGLLYLILAIPCFALIVTGQTIGIISGLLVMGTILASQVGMMPATLAAAFPTAIRYGALAVTYNLTISLFGATSLPINAWLIYWTGNPYIPAYYIMGAALIGLSALPLLRETRNQPLPGSAACLLEDDLMENGRRLRE